jgi:hypothetical protein
MSAQHTPGPVQLFEVGDRVTRFAPATMDKLSLLTIVQEDGVSFAAFSNDADARRFEQCWNAHDELVAAAKQAEKWIAVQMAVNGWPPERLAHPPEGSHLFNLHAAIAAATGQKGK